MFDSKKSRECLNTLIGWRNHYDETEIPELTPELSESTSGEYYQDKHPALRLDLIKQSLPENRDLEEYLTTTESAAITELLNEISVEKQMKRAGEDVVTNDVIYNSEGWRNDIIINEARFVGVRFRPLLSIGLKATINRIALQLTQAQTNLKLYLYHSHRSEKLAEIDYTTTVGGQFNWISEPIEMMGDSQELSGGSFYIGYYQDDLSGNAIKYKNLNWKTGFCGGCDGGIKQGRYASIAKYVRMQAFYVPQGNIDPLRGMFNPDDIIETDTNNWGFNFNISIRCDLTSFWCDNKTSLKHILALKLTQKILKDISFSQQINYVEEQLKALILRDLEGDKETNYINIQEQYKNALKALRLDQSGLNSICLPCAVKSGVNYSTM